MKNQTQKIKGFLKGKRLVLFLILIGSVIFTASFLYIKFIPGENVKENTMTGKEAVEKALEYLNKNILPEGLKAELLGEIMEELGLYKFKIKIQDEELLSYISKDGKIFFPQAINLTEEPKSSQNEDIPATTCEDLQKSEKPLLEAFIVSYCPYGLQMQRILSDVLLKIPSLMSSIKIRYLGEIKNGEILSMHGEEEAQENLRQICLREEQNDKYLSYLSCFIKKGEMEKCLDENGVDKNKLQNCQKDALRGLAYAKEDFELQDNYNVSGSPNLILNTQQVQEFDFGGRTTQAIKDLICCGFNQKPEFCSTELSNEQASTGFSEDYSSGGSSGGSCE